MKRRIACLLICVCLLLCMALPAGAQDEGAAFTDRGSIRNVGAVQMLVDLGLISGYDDGTFRSGNFITREEVAKLVAILCTENPQAPADVYFYDAQNSWALGYIGYCAGQGIIAGDGMGSFRPTPRSSYIRSSSFISVPAPSLQKFSSPHFRSLRASSR